MRCFLYTRFSPRRNSDDCESIEVQAQRCESYALHQWGVEDTDGNAVGDPFCLRYHDPSVSGGTPLAERPDGSKLVARLQRGDVLVVQRLDRLFRDAADGIAWVREWTRRGVAVHLADQGGCSIDCSSAVGRFMIGQLLLQAEFEKDLIGEKTSGAMRHHQRNGRRMSHHAPYGQTLDPADASMWIEDPDEQAAIRAIVQMRDGGTSYAKIAECLQHNDDVYPSRSGEWHSETVRRIYTRVQETN